jgi:hypothetical protein
MEQEGNRDAATDVLVRRDGSLDTFNHGQVESNPDISFFFQ